MTYLYQLKRQDFPAPSKQENVGRKLSKVPGMAHERDHKARMIYCGGAIYIILAAFSDPQSMSNYLLRAPGGGLVIWALALAAGILVLDMIINDLLPPAYRFHWAYERRPAVYVLTSFLYLIPLYVATKHEAHVLTVAGAYLYTAMSATGVALAFSAVVQRHRHRFGGDRSCDT